MIMTKRRALLKTTAVNECSKLQKASCNWTFYVFRLNVWDELAEYNVDSLYPGRKYLLLVKLSYLRGNHVWCSQVCRERERRNPKTTTQTSWVFWNLNWGKRYIDEKTLSFATFLHLYLLFPLFSHVDKLNLSLDNSTFPWKLLRVIERCRIETETSI